MHTYGTLYIYMTNCPLLGIYTNAPSHNSVAKCVYIYI